MDSAFLWPLLGVLGGLGGSFLGSYLKKKGENLATHEDIDRVVKQVSAVTEATKAIEAKVSGEMWDRQTQWELKRDVLLDAMRKLAQMPQALVELRAAYDLCPVEDTEARMARVRRWESVQAEFDCAVFVAGLVCGQRATDALLLMCKFGRETANAVMAGEALPRDSSSADSWDELGLRFKAAVSAIRVELGLSGEGGELSRIPCEHAK